MTGVLFKNNKLYTLVDQEILRRGPGYKEETLYFVIFFMEMSAKQNDAIPQWTWSTLQVAGVEHDAENTTKGLAGEVLAEASLDHAVWDKETKYIFEKGVIKGIVVSTRS